jgi:hypothetical protein
MKKHIVLTIFLFISFYSFSQTVIWLDKVSKHIGNSIKVCGRVSTVQLQGEIDFSMLFF